MKRLSLLFLISIAAGLVYSGPAAAAGQTGRSAAELYQQAGALVEQAKFDAALKIYAAAAKADPENQEYRQQYALLRQILKLREYYPLVDDADTRSEVAAALRAFYYDNRAYTAALHLDEQRHAELKTAESAAMVAESCLALNRNKEAIAVLSELDESRETMRTKVLHVIAMAREGMKEKAQTLAATIGKPETDDPGLYFEMACMHALLGNQSEASGMLARCFETTLPSQLEKARAKAVDRTDLKPLATGGEMTRLLAIESKVSESSCSSGASCATCPVRGNCESTGSTATGADRETDKK